MKPYEKLGEASTANGTILALYRHDGAYLIRADGVELMSTRRHLSEDRLAEVACAPIRERPHACVLIGGHCRPASPGAAGAPRSGRLTYDTEVTL
jgi:hypothetical protein